MSTDVKREKLSANAMQAKRLADEFRSRITGVNFRCECGAVHGLFYRIGKGDKKTLSYICDKVKKYWYFMDLDRNGEEFQRECYRYITQTIEAPVNIQGLAIPEIWTPQRKAEAQKKAQFQLAIPTTRKDV